MLCGFRRKWLSGPKNAGGIAPAEVYPVQENTAVRLAPRCQGKGYGTEALSAVTEFCFTKTELQRLRAEVDIRNIPSRKMLEKCGYQREGLIRQGKMVNTWCDYYICGKLVSDR